MSLVKRKIRYRLQFTAKMIVVWLMAVLGLLFFRNFGIEESRRFQEINDFDFNKDLLISLLWGVLTGLLYSLVEFFFDRPYFNRLSFGRLIIVKNILYFLGAQLVFLLLILFYTSYTEAELNTNILINTLKIKIFWVLLIYFLMISLLISFALQVSQKFGPGMLWKFNYWQIPSS